MSLQDQLRELFLLDQQVRGLRSRFESGARRQQVQQNKLDQLLQQQTELKQQVKHAEATAASLEHQSNDAEQRIAKLRDQMSTVTTNKEYSALLVEANTLKDEKSKLEDQALEQMSSVEALREQLTAIDEKIEQQTKVVELAGKEVEAAKAEVGNRLDEVTAKRDEAASVVPPQVLSQFERLVYSHDGEALAEVHEQDRRRMEYSCGGCFMSLPIEVVNKVMTKPDETTTCTNCGRILYINQDLKAELGSS